MGAHRYQQFVEPYEPFATEQHLASLPVAYRRQLDADFDAEWIPEREHARRHRDSFSPEYRAQLEADWDRPSARERPTTWINTSSR
jgi:hypothetical protein